MPKTECMTLEEFHRGLNEPYVFPGGYALYLLMTDGGCLRHDAAMAEQELIIQAIEDNDTTGGWLPLAWGVNWEDDDLLCDHTGLKIDPEYKQD